MWWKVIGGLLALWLAVALVGAVIGLVVDGLFWLALVAGALFVGSVVINRGRKGPRQLR